MNDIQALGNTYEDTHVVDCLNYRGFHINFYLDEVQGQYYTYWQGKRIDFGVYNTSYKNDMEYLIDRELDLITFITEKYEINPISGKYRLAFFKNNGYYDAGLYENGRLVYIINTDLQQRTADNYLEEGPAIKALIQAALLYLENKKLPFE